MSGLLWQLIENSAVRTPAAAALRYKDVELDYAELWQRTEAAAAGILALDVAAGDRVAIYLPKEIETVVAMFGASRAGATMVPVNPALKAGQVSYILQDCNVRVLVTSRNRLSGLADHLAECGDLQTIVLTGEAEPGERVGHAAVISWDQFMAGGEGVSVEPHHTSEADMAAILYTSGSTGLPKGVVLSHSNMVMGAISVATYLENTPDDRLLAVLPFSFDYGFSQMTTAFYVGASVTLMNHLFPKDIPKMVAKDGITGLACVPPLWFQLADIDWPEEARGLRYITSTGGRMPHPLVTKLQDILSETNIFLMYGLTEAFRSTFLPPDAIEARPNSIGKAIPNAEILVARPDGTLCDPDEPGELVHRGPLVGMGYWNDPERTAVRYKPVPGQGNVQDPEIAVWSGDTVKKDADGYIYFVGRSDDMIKTSGFRVSPTEVEEAVYASGAVAEVAAIGIEDPALGEAIVVVATKANGKEALDETQIMAHCRRELPSYMVPGKIFERDDLPRNANGKIDRKLIKQAIVDAGENENEGE